MAKRKPRRVSVPQKLTLAWLWNHVPLSWWAALAAAFVSVFSAGISIGQSEAYGRIIKETRL